MARRTLLYPLRPVAIRVVNPLLRHVAPHLPTFALVRYRGRKTGRAYEIPLNVFRSGDEWVIVLTYGSDAEWVKNVLAAGEAEMTTRGRRVRLVDPRLDDLALAPALVQLIAPILGVTEVVRLREA